MSQTDHKNKIHSHLALFSIKASEMIVNIPISFCGYILRWRYDTANDVLYVITPSSAICHYGINIITGLKERNVTRRYILLNDEHKSIVLRIEICKAGLLVFFATEVLLVHRTSHVVQRIIKSQHVIKRVCVLSDQVRLEISNADGISEIHVNMLKLQDGFATFITEALRPSYQLKFEDIYDKANDLVFGPTNKMFPVDSGKAYLVLPINIGTRTFAVRREKKSESDRMVEVVKKDDEDMDEGEDDSRDLQGSAAGDSRDLEREDWFIL